MTNPLLLVLLAVIAPVATAQDGYELFRSGDYVAAQKAFREALAADDEDPRLAWNLAMASWRAGDAEAAEVAAEKAAALSDGEYASLRDGLLGSLRYDAARALPEDQLQEAVRLARQARDAFARGALKDRGNAPMRRNLARAQRLLKDLEEKLEEQSEEQPEDGQDDQNDQDPSEDQEDQEGQGEQEQQQDGDQKPGEQQSDQQQSNEKQSDEQQSDEKQSDQQQSDEKQSDEKQSDEQQSSEGAEQSEPERPEGSSSDEPKDDVGKPEQSGDSEPEEGREPDQPESTEGPEPELADGEERPAQQLPGEMDPTRELSPEQRMRLLEMLKELEEQRDAQRAKWRARRPKVKKDW